MQQIPANLSMDDLQQWLGHCYFYHRLPTGEFKLSVLCSTPGGPGIIHVDDNVTLEMPPTNQLFCHWPIGGAINWPHTKYAVYTERNPRKQWKRSFYPQYYTIRRLGYPITHEFQVEKNNTKSIMQILRPTYYPYTQAIYELFPDGWESVALTPQITLVPGELTKVYYNRDLVGKITKQNTLFLTEPTLRRAIIRHLDGLVE